MTRSTLHRTIVPLVLCFASAAALATSPQTQADLNQRMKSCDIAVVRGAIDESEHDPSVPQEPIRLLLLSATARGIGDREHAAFLYLAGRLRLTEALLFVPLQDRGLPQALIPKFGELVMPSMVDDPAMGRRVVERVLAWDRVTSDPARDRPEARQSPDRERLAESLATLEALPAQLDAASTADRDRARETDRAFDERVQSARAAACGAANPGARP